LKYLKSETKVWFEITTLLIPGENDSDAELEAETQWIMENLGSEVPLHFTAFHPDWKMLDKPRTPAATLHRARRLALKNGLKYVYCGNILDSDSASTYCRQCGERLIGRWGYEITRWKLSPDGCCPKCGASCPGVFEAQPGDWGSKRLPVKLHPASDSEERLRLD
jgi:pyruvate formate lyase activating enzyme